MSARRSELVVRTAHHEDYLGVMAISGEESDYLYGRYHNYLHDPDAHCRVAEHNGEIVGFSFGYLLAGGQCVLVAGARTKAHMQDKGVMRACSRGPNGHMTSLQRLYPQLTRLIFTSANWKRFEEEARIKPGMRILDKWHYITYFVDADKFRQKPHGLDIFNAVNIQTPGLAAIDNLLRDDAFIADMFKGDQYVVCLYNWFPMPITQESLINMARLSNIMTTTDSEGKCCAISFCALSKIVNGVKLAFHMRHTGVNTLTVAAHVMAQVMYSCRMTPPEKTVWFVSAIPMDVDADELRRMLHPFLGKNDDKGSDFGVLMDDLLVTPKAAL